MYILSENYNWPNWEAKSQILGFRFILFTEYSTYPPLRIRFACMQCGLSEANPPLYINYITHTHIYHFNLVQCS